MVTLLWFPRLSMVTAAELHAAYPSTPPYHLTGHKNKIPAGYILCRQCVLNPSPTAVPDFEHCGVELPWVCPAFFRNKNKGTVTYSFCMRTAYPQRSAQTQHGNNSSAIIHNWIGQPVWTLPALAYHHLQFLRYPLSPHNHNVNYHGRITLRVICQICQFAATNTLRQMTNYVY